MQATAIIKALGGSTSVAKALGINRGAASQWGTAGIPAKFWMPLSELARTLGRPDISFDVLSCNEAPKPHRIKRTQPAIHQQGA